MKISLGLVLLSFSFSSFADFAAYSKLSDFKVINDAGKEVYKTDISNIKKVDLREDVAAIQSAYNTLTVVDKFGKVLVDQAYASDYQITSKYFMALGGKILKVYNRQGTSFINESWIKAAGISSTMFAYREDRAGSTLVVKNEQGQEIFSQAMNIEAKISDNFLFAKDSYGYLSLVTANGDRLEYNNMIVSYDLSDNFATFTDTFGFTKVINAAGDTILSGFGLKIKTLLNDLFSYEQNGQTFVVNKDMNQVFWSSNAIGNIQILDKAMAFKDNMNLVRFYNPEGASIMSGPVQSYFLTNNLLGYQNSAQNFCVFTFNKFKIYEENNADLASAAVSSQMFALKTKTANGIRIYDAKATKLVDEIQVQNYWISTSQPNLNWQKF